MPHKDPTALREYRRKYYSTEKWKKQSREYTKRWRQRNPDWVRASNKRANEKGRSSAKARAGYLVSRAKLRAGECALTREWVQERIERGCEITGLPFDVSTARRHPLSPSLDRMNPKKGYLPSNCRVIALALNVGLSDWGLDVVMPIWRVVLDKTK